MNKGLLMRSLALTGLALLLGLSGCKPHGEQTPKQDAPASATPAPRLPGEEDILVRVEGQPITAYDLQQAMRAMLGPQQAALLDAEGRHKVLESLVLSRLMAIRAEAELDAQHRRAIEVATRAHREQLLAAQYLKQHAAPTPVTDAAVQAYYNDHPEAFGGGRVRHYELLLQTAAAPDGQREAALNALQTAATRDDWRQAAQASGGKLAFRGGEVNKNLLQPQLLALLEPLKVGEVSTPTYLQGRAYIARISDEQQRQARPLAEVRAQIRRALAPVQLKKAVQQLSTALLKNARVDYITEQTSLNPAPGAE